ncbi:MAG TPA: hypothetical protein VJ552_10855 [Sediminibacterium sp.]|nr:hypothetical protein [Sediminibacterium sp.]
MNWSKKSLYGVFILVLLSGLLVYSSFPETYYRTDTGLRYRLINGNSRGPVARMGYTAKIHYCQKVGERVIDQTYDIMPLYYTVMPGYGNRYNPLEVFDYGLKKGDSVVTVQLVDSMIRKHILKQIPSWMKPADEWVTSFKVEEVFTNDSLLQADKLKEMGRVKQLQQVLGMARIQAYLREHHIRAVQQKDACLQWIRHGAGMQADTGTVIKAVLNVRTLKDTLVTRQDTVSFITGRSYWPYPIEQLTYRLKAGSLMRLYLPAVLVTGATPSSEKIKVNDDLIIDMEVLEMKGKKVNTTP